MWQEILTLGGALLKIIGALTVCGFIIVCLLAYCTPVEVEKEPEEPEESDEDLNHVIF